MTDDPRDADIDKRLMRLPPVAKAKLLKYVKDTGWLRSVLKCTPIDRVGQPLPWYTYAAINFLTPRITPDLSVFEFGSGQSTLWWATRVEHVVSIEHDAKWFERVNRTIPSNVTYSHIRLVRDADYCRAAERAGRKFDVIVVDGRDRLNCAAHSLSALSARGVVIWDNSEREQYQPGKKVLLASGFRKVEFIGNGPLNTSVWETSIFYRRDNWLGL